MEGKQRKQFFGTIFLSSRFHYFPFSFQCLNPSISAKGSFSSALSFLDRNNDQESKLRQNEWNEIKRGRKRKRESGFNEEPNDGFEEGKDPSVLLVKEGMEQQSE